jgi:hypothetical protein
LYISVAVTTLSTDGASSPLSENQSFPSIAYPVWEILPT